MLFNTMNNIWYIFNTKNTKIDTSMPHRYFRQQVAARGSATLQGNVFVARDHNITMYFTKIIVIIKQHV